MSALALRPAAWRLERRTVLVRGREHSLRLVRFERGWIASVDTVTGPTMGVDHSPYLAAGRALEPLGTRLADAMALVGRIDR